MKHLLPLFSLFLLMTTNLSLSAQTPKEKTTQQEPLINIQADKELREYFTEAELFMMTNQKITESVKREMIERQKKYLEEQKNRPPQKDYYKSELLISTALQKEHQWNYTYRSYDEMGWVNIWHHIEAKAGKKAPAQFEGKSNTSYPCKISFISKSEFPILLQFLSKDTGIEIPVSDLQIAPKDTVLFEFDYFVEAGYIEKNLQLQMTTQDTVVQIEMPIVSLGFDLISHEFASYRNLDEEPVTIDKNKALHFVKKNQETVFSLYPFNTFEKPTFFEPNQEPIFAAPISGNYTQIDLEQVESGMYLARIIDFSQRNQAFRVVWIE